MASEDKDYWNPVVTYNCLDFLLIFIYDKMSHHNNNPFCMNSLDTICFQYKLYKAIR